MKKLLFFLSLMVFAGLNAANTSFELVDTSQWNKSNAGIECPFAPAQGNLIDMWDAGLESPESAERYNNHIESAAPQRKASSGIARLPNEFVEIVNSNTPTEFIEAEMNMLPSSFKDIVNGSEPAGVIEVTPGKDMLPVGNVLIRGPKTEEEALQETFERMAISFKKSKK